jgi:hypothetical protein
MRSRIWITALVAALMLMSMAGISAIAQEATPAGEPAPGKVNGIDCGPNVELFDPAALPRAIGVKVVFACAYFATGDNVSGGLAVIGTLSTVDKGMTIENPVEGTKIRQTGTANITVIQGSLTVELIANCADAQGCSGGTGIARFARTDVDNTTVWTDLEIGTSVDILPGDLLIVENVTVTFTAGDNGALVSSSGAYNPGPGEGCPVRCWQFP